MILGGTSSPYRSCRDRLRCRASATSVRSCARGALQSVRFGCLALGVTTGGRPLLGLAARPEFLARRRIARIGWAVPLCRWPFPRLCGFSPAGFAGHLFSVQSSPLFEFRLPLESYPARPSRSAAADQLLSWALVPYSTSRIEGPLSRVRPPATFRLQGLATLLAAYSLQSRAGFLSHRQRSWDSPFGAFSSRTVSGLLPPGSPHLPSSLSLLPTP
jgi:hypothetical protein